MSFPAPTNPESARQRLLDLGFLFLRLGATAFGGPAAHLAMMEDEVVRRRQWLTRDEYLDILGATQLIPGPNSTEMAIHIGHRRAGWPGLLVAGVSFILPAACIVTAMAWAYVRFGDLPRTEGLLYGVKPVMIAVVLQALWSLGRTAVRTWNLGLVGLGAVTLAGFGFNELQILLGTGLLAAALGSVRQRTTSRVNAALLAATPMPSLPLPLPLTAMTGAATAATVSGLSPLFLVFLKIGSVLFGSGYVLLAYLRADLVERRHWLTESQLLDAVAVGQLTPGPVLTTATFIGYLLGGMPGAFVSTAGIFLPAFFFVAISGPLIPRLRACPPAGAFLDGINVASLALMAVVTWQLAHAAMVDGPTIGIALASLILLIRYRVNSAWLVLGGASIGLLSTPWR